MPGGTSTIATIKTLNSVGILADKAARDSIPLFRRFNLIYGFNGSGKSTLSRIFACLEAGKHHEELPANCSFEIALDDGTTLKAPNALAGLESRICVFNEDFIARNLRWQEGRASSIFYISEEQSDLAAKLRAAQPPEAARGRLLGEVGLGRRCQQAPNTTAFGGADGMKLPRGPRGEILPRPSYTAARKAKATADCLAEKNARKALRAALTRHQNARGRDDLISALKIELEALGEEPKLLHSLAPAFDATGQSSILNIASGSPSQDRKKKHHTRG